MNTMLPIRAATLAAVFTLNATAAEPPPPLPGPVVKEYVVRPAPLDTSQPQRVEPRSEFKLPAVGTAGALAVPRDIHLEFEPGRTNYVAFYTVTNQTSRPIQLQGYAASCQCAHVETTGPIVPAAGTIQVRAVIQRPGPSVQYVILQDTQTNLYQTVIWIQPNP